MFAKLTAGCCVLYFLAGYPGPAAAAQAQTGMQSAATVYKDECASCHMAYPPGLMPRRSWQKILASLEQHFGDNASLEPASLRTLSQYLQSHSADAGNSHLGHRVLRSLAAADIPLRITELPYIRRQHAEIPARYIRANPQVRSLGNCIACHQGAERGIFSEDTVRIPGYGRWDD